MKIPFMRSEYVEKLLCHVNFENLVQIIPENHDNAHEIFAILSPLLTRVHRVRWGELTLTGGSWLDTLTTIDCLGQRFKQCDEWSMELIAEIVADESGKQSGAAMPVDRLLYLSILSSEFRLPLVSALYHLGQSDCVGRLDYVCRSIKMMHLVG
jgi:hypothetical protein